MPLRSIHFDDEETGYRTRGDADVGARPLLPVLLDLRRVSRLTPIDAAAVLGGLVRLLRSRWGWEDLPSVAGIAHGRFETGLLVILPGPAVGGASIVIAEEVVVSLVIVFTHDATSFRLHEPWGRQRGYGHDGAANLFSALLGLAETKILTMAASLARAPFRFLVKVIAHHASASLRGRPPWVGYSLVLECIRSANHSLAWRMG